jgi:hypothetical protein
MDEFKGDEPLDPIEAMDEEVEDEMEGMHIDGEEVADDDDEVPIETDL